MCYFLSIFSSQFRAKNGQFEDESDSNAQGVTTEPVEKCRKTPNSPITKDNIESEKRLIWTNLEYFLLVFLCVTRDVTFACVLRVLFIH